MDDGIGPGFDRLGNNMFCEDVSQMPRGHNAWTPCKMMTTGSGVSQAPFAERPVALPSVSERAPCPSAHS
jgi:hypothetical protein